MNAKLTEQVTIFFNLQVSNFYFNHQSLMNNWEKVEVYLDKMIHVWDLSNSSKTRKELT